MAEEQLSFRAEVSRLLDIVAHSLYSEKQIFLRELISNASDACDRLRYAALTQPDLTGGDSVFRIVLSGDRAARTLTIADNGIGMNREDLVANLGTIARSGTAAFLGQISGDAKKDFPLIGQFGVGFYSAFMVADRVEVLSRKAGEAGAFRWSSDGKGSFTVAEADSGAIARGTKVTLHMKAGEDDFLDPARLRHIVKTYSDHIGLPVLLADGGTEETLNAASALWTRPKAGIAAEQYKEFYHHAAHAFDDPWLTLHYRAEGKIEYTALLFVPSARPFDLFDPARKPRVKLYVRRVFITDDQADLLPPWLRFLRGVVDSEDLPLNISREMLQHNPVLARIRQGLTARVLSELQKKAEADPAAYGAFWDNFGAVLKEGLYEDREQREALLGLARFRTTAADGLTSLEAYVGRMKPGQDAIYFIAGDDAAALGRSPQLEGYAARGVEVLLLADPVDEFWTGAVGAYKDKPLKSVTRGAADLSKIPQAEAAKPAAPEPPAGLDGLIALLKLALKDQVKDVRASDRLTDSAVCLVADEGDVDMHLERLLRQHRRIDSASRRILEINPGHDLIRKLAGLAGSAGAADRLADAAQLLFDQARIMEGEALDDRAAFARRLAGVMARSLESQEIRG